MNYKIINSGSDGNATVIEKIILIDCGLALKQIEDYISNIEIVLLTHEHSDHFNSRTIARLTKEKPNLKFACGEWLKNRLIRCGVNEDRIDVLEIGKMYNYNKFKISAIKAYHDVPNIGYRIYIEDKKLLYITDTSTLDGIKAKDYDVYLVEANYEENQLKEELELSELNGEFNYRKRVQYTHLSKEKCLDFYFNNCKEDSKLEFMHVHKDR